MPFVKIGVGQNRLPRHIVERDVLRREFGGGRDNQRMAHTLRIGNRPLQSLHTAQAAADNRRPLPDAQIISQQRLRFHPVFNRNQRKIRTVVPTCFGILRQRAGTAVATAQIVQADHEKPFRINRFARPHHTVPPARVFIVRRITAGNVVVARQGMADKYGVAFFCVQHTVCFNHQVETRQVLAVLQRERRFKRNFLRYAKRRRGIFTHVCSNWCGKKVIIAV